MPKYRFEDIAINCTEKIKQPSEADQLTYIGLEHLDSGSLYVNRYGSAVPIKGEKLVMHKGDVLFGKRNAYLRRAAIAPHDGIFSAHGMVFRPKEKFVDKDFFPLFIASDYFFDAAIKISVGSLSPTVNWKDLREIEFTIPDLETQRKLADVLWAMNDTMEAYKKLLATTDDMVKARFVEMFGDPEFNTKAWPIHLLEKLCNVRSSKRIYQNEQSSVGVPFWRVSDLINKIDTGISDSNLFIPEDKFMQLKEAGLVPIPGDILVTSRGTLGRCYIIKNNDRFYFQDGMISWLSDYNKCITPLYLQYLFMMPGFRKQINCIQVGTTVAYLSLVMLKKLQIMVPSKESQDGFSAFVIQIDKSKSELQKALTELTALYKRILQDNLV